MGYDFEDTSEEIVGTGAQATVCAKDEPAVKPQRDRYPRKMFSAKRIA